MTNNPAPIFIEQRIRQALSEQATWESLEIPDAKLTRLAEAVRSELGLTEFDCDGERWWSTRFYPVDEGSGEVGAVPGEDANQ